MRYAPGAPGATTYGVSPTACFNGAVFAPLPPPNAFGGGPIALGAVELVVAPSFHAGEPIFVRLTDADKNQNPALVENVTVNLAAPSSGDAEQVQLQETGVNTGVFVGYIPSSAPPAPANNCVLAAPAGQNVTAAYTDPLNAGDTSSDSALIDPESRVFDSSTGSGINGAQVTLIDDATGLPAAGILGDDGVSSFPSTVTSGGTVTDGGGAVYNFGSGGFRFPIVPAGSYRYAVTPSGDYVFPSVVPDATLQALPGAPFALGRGLARGGLRAPGRPDAGARRAARPDRERRLHLDPAEPRGGLDRRPPAVRRAARQSRQRRGAGRRDRHGGPAQGLQVHQGQRADRRREGGRSGGLARRSHADLHAAAERAAGGDAHPVHHRRRHRRGRRPQPHQGDRRRASAARAPTARSRSCASSRSCWAPSRTSWAASRRARARTTTSRASRSSARASTSRTAPTRSPTTTATTTSRACAPGRTSCSSTSRACRSGSSRCPAPATKATCSRAGRSRSSPTCRAARSGATTSACSSSRRRRAPSTSGSRASATAT